MNRFISFIVVLLCSVSAYSQECTTTWPYLYPAFQDATIYTADGKTLRNKVNVHVRKSTLHYLDGDLIKEAKSEDMLLVTIGDDKYMCVNGQLMKVLGSDKTGFVATLILADFNKLSEPGGAYGSSSNSSATRKLTSLETDNAGKMNHMELWNNKNNGTTLALNYKYYIVTDGTVYEATRKGIGSKLSKTDNEKFKVFLKTNKIEWKNPESLLKLLDFLNKN